MHTNLLALAQARKPLYHFVPQPQPRLTLGRVLYNRLLRWIEKASLETLRKTAARTFYGTLTVALVFAPLPTLETMLSVLRWNGSKIPLCLGALWLLLNARRIYRYLKRSRSKPSSNQHCFHGIPVPQLCDYLVEQQSFKRDEAMSHFAISQDQHQAIADELEKHQVLVRGEKNARVLNDIPRDILARQLRDGFPLVFDPVRKEWLLRDGPFSRWVLDREHDEQKRGQRIERLERKKERLEEQVEELSTFGQIMAA